MTLVTSASFSFILAGHNDNLVAFFNFQFCLCHLEHLRCQRDNFHVAFTAQFTGYRAKIRVPIGSPCLLIKTTALPSKRMVSPLSRCKTRSGAYNHRTVDIALHNHDRVESASLIDTTIHIADICKRDA